jgi:hypothetical protein
VTGDRTSGRLRDVNWGDLIEGELEFMQSRRTRIGQESEPS